MIKNNTALNLFLCFLFAFSVYGEENTLLTVIRDAEAYYEAEEFGLSEKAYRKALSTFNLTEDQRDTLRLNMGMVMIDDGRYQDAINTLEKIREETSPLVKRRQNTFLAIAYQREAQEKLEELEVLSDSFSQDLKEISLIVDQAFFSLQRADEFDAQLAKIEGRERDGFPTDLQLIYDSIKETFVLVGDKEEEHKLETLGLSYSIKRIYSGVTHLILTIDNIARYKALPVGFLEDYMVQFHRAEEVDQKVWSKARDQVGDLPKQFEGKAFDVAFYKAEEHYFTASDYMKEGDLWNARRQLGKAAMHLDHLVIILDGKDPVAKSLQSLLFNRAWAIEVYDFERLVAVLFEEDESLQLLALKNTKDLLEQKIQEQDGKEEDYKLLREIALIQKLYLDVEKGAWKELSREALDTAYVKAIYNEAFYEHVNLTEEEALYHLYRHLVFKRELGLNETDFLQLPWQVDFLLEDFTFRKEVGDERVEDIDQMIPWLIRAKEIDLRVDGPQGEFFSLIEQALILWAPKYYTLAAFEGLSNQHERVKQDSFQKSSVDDLITQYLTTTSTLQKLTDEEILSTLPSYLKSEEIAGYGAGSDDPRGKEKKSLFFGTSNDLLKAAIDDVKGIDPETPVDVLKQAVENQKQALNALTAVGGLHPSSEPTAPFLELLKQEQSLVNKMAGRFIPSIKDGAKENPEGGWDEMCLAPPWSEVLTLFHQGYDLADAVYKELDIPYYDFEGLESKHRNIIHYWEEALKKLQDDSESQDQQEQQDSPEKEEEDSRQDQQQEQQQQEQKALDQEILEMLLQMDKEDEPKEEGKGKAKSGLRPW